MGISLTPQNVLMLNTSSVAGMNTRVLLRTSKSLMRDFFMSPRLTQDYIIVVWGLPL